MRMKVDEAMKLEKKPNMGAMGLDLLCNCLCRIALLSSSSTKIVFFTNAF